ARLQDTVKLAQSLQVAIRKREMLQDIDRRDEINSLVAERQRQDRRPAEASLVARPAKSQSVRGQVDAHGGPADAQFAQPGGLDPGSAACVQNRPIPLRVEVWFQKRRGDLPHPAGPPVPVLDIVKALVIGLGKYLRCIQRMSLDSLPGPPKTLDMRSHLR